MEVIYKAARRGKTHDIVDVARRRDAYIVVPFKSEAVRILRDYPGCPPVFTFQEILQNRLKGTHGRIVIDNADQCIQSLTQLTIRHFHLSSQPEQILVEAAKKHNAYIVVLTANDAVEFADKYQDLRFPVTYSEFYETRGNTSFVADLVFKDFDESVKISLLPHKVIAISVNNPIDKELAESSQISTQ